MTSARSRRPAHAEGVDGTQAFSASILGRLTPGALRWSPTGRTWCLWVDGMPPSPNDRLHHMARAKITKHWRDVAKWKALSEGIPPLRFVRISAVIYRRALGVADEDNDRARLKPLVDGLRDAGVIPTDTRNYVEYGPVTEERGVKGIRLVIEEQALAPAGPAAASGGQP